MHFLFHFFGNLTNYKYFSEARFLFFGLKEKWQSHEKKYLEIGRNGVKTGRFYLKLHKSILTGEKFTSGLLSETLYVTTRRPDL